MCMCMHQHNKLRALYLGTVGHHPLAEPTCSASSQTPLLYCSFPRSRSLPCTILSPLLPPALSFHPGPPCRGHQAPTAGDTRPLPLLKAFADSTCAPSGLRTNILILPANSPTSGGRSRTWTFCPWACLLFLVSDCKLLGDQGVDGDPFIASSPQSGTQFVASTEPQLLLGSPQFS